MSGMAEVLAAHQHAYSLVTVSDPHSECSCGEVTPINIPGGWNPGCTSAFVESQRVASHTAHQAAMLTAAGFGPVKEAKATALEEEARDLGWFGAQGNLVHPDTAWAGITACRNSLRARAAAVRGES